MPIYHTNISQVRAHNVQLVADIPASLKIAEVIGLQGYTNDKFYALSSSRSVIKVRCLMFDMS